MKTKYVVAGFGVVAALLVTSALAQTIFGTILGTVTDASGAVVPNLAIKVINQGENTSRDARTDAQGNYQAENLKERQFGTNARVGGAREVTVKDIVLT